MQELCLLAHNTLVGEAHWQTMVLYIIILAGGDVLSLIRPPRSHSDLAYVSRCAEAHTVQRLAIESHGKLIHD